MRRDARPTAMWFAAALVSCVGAAAGAGEDKLLCDTVIQDIDLGLDGCRSITVEGSLAVLQQQGDEFELPNSLRFFNNVDGQWIEDVDQQLELPSWSGTWFPRQYLSLSGDTLLCSISVYPSYVMVVSRGESGWAIQQVLDPPPGSTDDQFGQNVAIDGDVAVVSDVGANGGAGVVNVYRRAGSYWVIESQLTSGTGDYLGTGIAIEGDRLITGATDGIHAFEYDGTSWSETQVFEGNSSGMDLQGDQAIVGNNIYDRVDGAWTLSHQLASPVGGDDALSWSKSYLSGNLAAYNVANADDGRLYTNVFEFNGTEWAIVDSIVCSDDGNGYPSPFVMTNRSVLMGYVNSTSTWKFGRLLTHAMPDQSNGVDVDCNANGQCDSVDLASLASADCDGNGVPDECDLAEGVYSDINGNGIPDVCEADCDGDGVPDAGGDEPDCNGNGIPDSCDIADGWSPDTDGDGVPDECDLATPLIVAADGSEFFSDIQQALNVALPGATIWVEPGIYVGPYMLPQHAVALRSTDGPAVTELLPPSADARVMTIPNAGVGTLVEGFSMGGSTQMQEGGGLLLVDSAVTLRDCVFLNNLSTRGAGTMITGRHSSGEPSRFEDCIWSGNVSNSEDLFTIGSGGGVCALDAAIVLERCAFVENVAVSTGGGIYLAEGSDATFTECLFERNESGTSGSAITVLLAGVVEITDTYFCGNVELNGDFYSDIFGSNWIDGGGNVFVDACPGDCPGDANADGVVNVEDLLSVIYDWGTCDPNGECPGDLNGDGFANVDDLLLVIANWGTVCGFEAFAGCTGGEDVNEAVDFGCVCNVDGDDSDVDCNGGYNTDGSFTPYIMGQTVCGNASVFYADNGNIWRDTDWWDDFGVVDAGGTFTAEIGSGASQIVAVLDLDGLFFVDGVANPEGEVVRHEFTIPPGNYCIWTGPLTWNEAWTCDSGLADYVFSVTKH